MREKKLVLLADDDIDLVETMKIVLEAEGYEILAAYDTVSAFNKLKSEKPDVMVLDVMFGPSGKTNGLELVSKIRQDSSIAGTPILMITSVNLKLPVFDALPEMDGIKLPSDGTEKAGTDEIFTLDVPAYLPVDGFINKPAQPDELAEKVKALLAQKVSKWAGWKKK
ncbi:MAG: response regulator [Candidatus Firestonebacteria bacterium]